jgi:hypothetical protein
MCVLYSISKPRASSIRKDYHMRCTCPLHQGYGKQKQTCKNCIYDVAKRCFVGGLSLHQTCKQAQAIGRSYFCPFCIEKSVEAGSFAAPTPLQIFRSCHEHREHYLRKRCPCGLLWTNCLRCMDEEVDPRAGTSFCTACRKRRGPPTRSGRFCSCCQAGAQAEAEWSGSPETVAWSEDEELSRDEYLVRLGDSA